MNITDIISNNQFTILLGKNGSGKSTLLRSLANRSNFSSKYISPERGGTLRYDPNIENNINRDAGYLTNTRQKNRFEQFREQSAVQFRTLELTILREIEKDKRQDLNYTFESYLEKINFLLPSIMLVRSAIGFSIQSKTGTPISEEQISSGESELIALAIEVLVYSKANIEHKLLLLDEPDVHLHPDLQQKFISFVESTARENNFKAVIATHSTAIISAFSEAANPAIVPIENRDQEDFKIIERSEICEQILPVFGAHPLSTAFNLNPILLVEGDDDKRVFEQAIRSSNGRFSFTPCPVGTVNEMNNWETWLSTFLPILYDNPKAYSLRDLDQSQQTDITNIGVVTRLRLNCYSIENLILTTECLNKFGFDEESFKLVLASWINKFPDHRANSELRQLLANFDNRRTTNIKNVRNILVAILDENKPWEVMVGQLISRSADLTNTNPNSINTYLGTKVLSNLFTS